MLSKQQKEKFIKELAELVLKVAIDEVPKKQLDYHLFCIAQFTEDNEEIKQMVNEATEIAKQLSYKN